MKLNQLLAILQSTKASSTKGKSEVYHLAKKATLFSGLSKTYQPREEDGFVYPPESQKLTLRAEALVQQFAQACAEYLDLTATQDWANTEAKASVEVDGSVVLADVPVSYLLFLEKQLQDVRTFIESLPVLPIDKEWEYNANRQCYATTPRGTVKTKKITDFVTVFEPTEHHPGQAKEVAKDVVEGTWTTVEFSGALPQARISELIHRVDTLAKAVLKAREAANSIDVRPRSVAAPIFGYIFE